MNDCRLCSHKEFCDHYHAEKIPCNKYTYNILYDLGWLDPYDENQHLQLLYRAAIMSYMWTNITKETTFEEKCKMAIEFNKQYRIDHPEFHGYWIGEI